MTLEHLRKHPDHPHVPIQCSFSRRELTSYHQNFSESLCDDRGSGDRRAIGKHHESVFDRPIFPIKSLDFVVPPVLHITLGIVMNGFLNIVKRLMQAAAILMRRKLICTTYRFD